ncbi:DUF3467 domain-containing protein [Methanohalophilus sp.]|uniref:DUF3467 domain-containing protein n=1 Tax=Methanohalophilus sp. TaxID=1966352 RepID=UPI00260FD98A|nr:DUF3467 domain-containing protein [Methanohalophilus sp.]MDK2891844.1 hypothetical protein [Methanohalophilus sp.]
MTEKVPENAEQPKRKVKIKLNRPDSFKQCYAIGAMGGHSPYDFRICFYNDTPKGVSENNEQVIERTLETEIILSPLAAMELSKWLNQHLNEYIAVFGPIKGKPMPKDEKPAKDDSAHLQGYI